MLTGSRVMRVASIEGPPDVRRHNLSVLLRLLHLGGPMRRAELTDLTGLNRSTIAGLVTELMALGAVVQGPGPPTGEHWPARAGRPSLVVSPCPQAAPVLAADLAVGRISMALIGLGGTVLARRTGAVSDTAPEAMARRLAAIAAELWPHPKAGGRVVGFGVSVPGVVRGSDGNVRFAPNLGWRDVPFGELLAAAVAAHDLGPVPIRIGNDGDLGALAEHQRGAARGIDDVVFVEGEVGVGCGVIVGGRPLGGAGGYAGELGHLSVRRGGRRCRCGARGCWETEIGAEAVARALNRSGPVGVEEVVTLLRGGGPQQAGQLDEVAYYLGIGLANVVNFLNPRLIILGGLLRELYPLVAGPVQQALRDAALRAPLEQLVLAGPELGPDAVLLGAAEFAWQDTLADPATALAGPVVPGRAVARSTAGR
jgi:predicted NBD/HSP70 family sugar kinase